jgi:hypothetical protein
MRRHLSQTGVDLQVATRLPSEDGAA